MSKKKTIKMGDLVFARRVALGTPKHPLSMADASIECKVSAATLSRIEKGSGSDLATFKKISRWLELGDDDILRLVKGE